MEIHCLFEQSGVFKNEFKKLGYQSYDVLVNKVKRKLESIIKNLNKKRTQFRDVLPQ